jgi:predicted transcriptional regulator
METEDLVSLTADIVVAHIGNNNLPIGDLGKLIQNVHGALAALQESSAPAEPEKKKGLVSVRASIRPDHLVCLPCGSRQKMLKRHLATAHGLTPDQYRADYGLPATYPMVAPDYSEQRRAIAHSIGLGRKPPKRRRRAEGSGSAGGRGSGGREGTT